MTSRTKYVANTRCDLKWSCVELKANISLVWRLNAKKRRGNRLAWISILGVTSSNFYHMIVSVQSSCTFLVCNLLLLLFESWSVVENKFLDTLSAIGKYWIVRGLRHFPHKNAYLWGKLISSAGRKCLQPLTIQCLPSVELQRRTPSEIMSKSITKTQLCDE